jgi:hypothetical protein
MIISRKRFEAEIQRRVEEDVCKAQERMFQEERLRDMYRDIRKIEDRLIEVEKKSGIDHPSHHNGSVLPN